MLTGDYRIAHASLESQIVWYASWTIGRGGAPAAELITEARRYSEARRVSKGTKS